MACIGDKLLLLFHIFRNWSNCSAGEKDYQSQHKAPADQTGSAG